jgi:aerobic carbon-monoxide dehydrogenase medium subunit
MTQATEVMFPTSADEAVAQFGDGSGVTVIGGGTIVVPDITYGRLEPRKAVMLSRAGLDTLDTDGSTVTLGAALPIARLTELADDVTALAQCALNVADYEIRRQGTVGGNLCAGAGADAPRGDLQGPLLALEATTRSVGSDGEVTEPLEDFLDHREGRLLLDVRFEKPSASAFAAIDYPHTHAYTVLAVTGVRRADGGVRLAATGLAGTGKRLSSAEAVANDPGQAGTAALEDVSFGDDAVASSWYRERTLPVLVRRVLSELEEAA